MSGYRTENKDITIDRFVEIIQQKGFCLTGELPLKPWQTIRIRNEKGNYIIINTWADPVNYEVSIYSSRNNLKAYVWWGEKELLTCWDRYINFVKTPAKRVALNSVLERL